MKIGFLGAGNIAQAIVKNLINNKTIAKNNIKLVDGYQPTYQKLVDQKFHVAGEWEFLSDCEVIFLCLKPQDIFNLKTKLSQTFANKIIISVAAGLSLAKLKAIFTHNHVTRIMTNLSLAKEKTSLMVTQEGDHQANDMVHKLFAHSTSLVTWKESNIHLFIALSGSANAFIYHFLQPMVDLATQHGIALPEVNEIINLLLISCGQTIKTSDFSLEQLINQVSSPNGTTVAGINSFKASNLQASITKGLQACIERSKELEAENSK